MDDSGFCGTCTNHALLGRSVHELELNKETGRKSRTRPLRIDSTFAWCLAVNAECILGVPCGAFCESRSLSRQSIGLRRRGCVKGRHTAPRCMSQKTYKRRKEPILVHWVISRSAHEGSRMFYPLPFFFRTGVTRMSYVTMRDLRSCQPSHIRPALEKKEESASCIAMHSEHIIRLSCSAFS